MRVKSHWHDISEVPCPCIVLAMSGSLALLHWHIAHLFKFLFVTQDLPRIRGSVYHPKYQVSNGRRHTDSKLMRLSRSLKDNIIDVIPLAFVNISFRTGGVLSMNLAKVSWDPSPHSISTNIRNGPTRRPIILPKTPQFWVRLCPIALYWPRWQQLI